jgi:DNA-binding XRE family transcriptional regulator
MVSTDCMSEFREVRRRIGRTQEEFAAALDVSRESCRAWDCGRRPIPLAVLSLAAKTVADHFKEHEWLTLQQLACELGVNVHTLRAAARTGRLRVQFCARSVFGRPRRRATRAAGREYLRTSYGKPAGRLHVETPLVGVPDDYAEQLKCLRRRLQLTQHALAQRVGAANKAVIYQWESGKRTPSPVFWAEIERLIAEAGSSQRIEGFLMNGMPSV